MKHFYFMQNQGSATVEVAVRSISRRTFAWVTVNLFSWTKWRKTAFLQKPGIGRIKKMAAKRHKNRKRELQFLSLPFRSNCLAQPGCTQPARRSRRGEGGSRLVTAIVGIVAQKRICIQDVGGSNPAHFRVLPHFSA